MLLQFSQIWECFFSIAVFRSLQTPQVFNEIYICAQCWPLSQVSSFEPSWVLDDVCIELTVTAMIFDGDCDTQCNIVLQKGLCNLWFHDAKHIFKAPTTRGSKATPKQQLTSAMWLLVQCYFLIQFLIQFTFPVNIECYPLEPPFSESEGQL